MLDRHRSRAAAALGLVLMATCACDGTAALRPDASEELAVSDAPDSEAATDAEVDLDADADADADSETQPQPDGDTELPDPPDADADGNADADAQPETDAGVETGPEADADVGPCAPSECPSPDPCLAAACAPAGTCQLALASSEACPYASVLFAEDAESPDAALLISDLAPSSAPTIGWTRSAHRAFTGDFGWYFGDPTALNFDNGERVAGRLAFPPLALPTDRAARLVFHVYADVEAGPTWDLLVVRVVGPDGSVPVYAKDAGFTVGGWQRVSVDLAAFAGRTVSIQFDFDSVEATLNDTEGLTLDAMWVLTDDDLIAGCSAAPDCDDAVACTSETCADAHCAYTPLDGCCALDGDCDDGDPCTQDVCVARTCSNLVYSAPGCCDCDDGDPCTVDACLDDACAHAPSTTLACCAPTALDETFEDVFTAWTFEGTSGDCTWHIESAPPAGGAAGALAYGNGTNYDCGVSSGVASSPTMTLTAGVRWTLETRAWFETEVASSVDVLSLYAVSAAGPEVLLWTRPAGQSVQKNWRIITRDLSAFGGLTMALKWRFDTDEINNAWAGPHIDAISLLSSCEPRACATPADCDDALAATVEDCVDGACGFTFPTP